jgi:succinyl-CoA synthetase beta subunit
VDQIATALEILTSHSKVESILINIFGGIMRCDTTSEGIIKATERVNVKIPLVVRLAGTNCVKALEILDEFREKNPALDITLAGDINDAAEKAVASLLI